MGEGHLPVQQSILSQIDFFLAALAQEPFYLIAATGEGVLVHRGGASGWGWWSEEYF